MVIETWSRVPRCCGNREEEQQQKDAKGKLCRGVSVCVCVSERKYYRMFGKLEPIEESMPYFRGFMFIVAQSYIR